MPFNKLKLFAFFWILLFPAVAQCQVAGFTVDNASGCVPLIVHFSNTSTGATSYSWNLGNSTSTTASDPSASYIAAGTYTVTLTAYNGALSSTSSMVITVYPLPTVGFSAADTTLCPGFPAIFTNTSVGGTPGTTSYTWNFGDGSTSVSPSPMYIHPSPGYYNITLFVTNSMGCFNSLSKPSYIQVYSPPVVGFSGTGAYICRPPSSVSFSNISTGTPPLTYNWSFGDGSATSPATAPSHVYSAPGSFDVRLKVTNGNGCIDSVLSPGYVYVGSLTATYTAPATVCQLIPVTFNNTSSAHLSSSWDFGDGFTSSDEMPAHEYASPGVYNPRLIVFDGSCYDTVVHSITVFANPTATFTITPTIPCSAPVTVNYAATVSPGSTASWKFLDGHVGTGLSTSHLYNVGTDARFDTVKLTVTNSNGCKIVVKKLDTVFTIGMSIMPLWAAGCIPLSTSFTSSIHAISYNPLTEESIVMPFPYTVSSYSWNFGDGSATVVGLAPAHTYTAVGVYTVSCTATTTTGCTKTATTVVRCGVPPPVISFTATPTHICSGRNINFATSGSSTINSYYWYWGDTQADSGAAFAAPSHLYRLPGIDTVKLRGYHNGCPSSQVKSVVIIDSPSAIPAFNNLCIPNNGIAFGDSSLGADSRLWIFGDGTTSAVKNPVHYYDALADYTVQLTTYNAASGCRDTMLTNVYLSKPFLYFVSPDPTVCLHGTAEFLPFVSGTPIPGFEATRSFWYVDGSLVGDFPGAGPCPPVPFHTPGYHDITFIIKNSRGCYDTFTRQDYVLTGSPDAGFSVTPSSGCGPLAVSFTDHSTGIPECRLMNYSWSFGDGAPAPTVSSTPGISNTYSLAGVYSVALTVTDSIGCTSTTDPPVVVTVYRPHAAFYADANNVCMGTNVHFNNTSASIASSFWMFGDGATSTVTSPYHIYATSGVYTVKLVVTDSHGCSDTATLLNYIYVAPSPHAAFAMSDSFAVCPPLNVNFTNLSTSAATYSWNFGNSSTSVALNPSSPYTAPGYYTVRLVARNSIGCTDTAIRHVNIFGYTGAFSYTPISGCMPLPVHFNASLGSFASMVWDFGDGFTSSVSLSDTISHLYPLQGKYVPKLILTDTTGCTNFSIGADTIKVDKVIPHFRITPNPVCQGSGVVFTDSSYAAYSPPSSWAWSFGSGATATGSSPAHTFTMAGTHAVSLTVTTGFGCSASVVRTVTVNAIPDTIVGVRTLCTGYTTLLSNTSLGGAWSTSAPGIATVSSGGVVSGLGVGTARISYTLSAGCLSTTVVTVYAVPGLISGVNSICQGDSTTFTCATPGGTWSSSAPLIAWVNSTSGRIAGVGSGTAIITYTLGSGCNTVKVITINATPTPITGIPSVCQGLVTTLYQSLTGGAWTSGLTTIATIDASGNVTGVAAGTSGITYAFSTGCKATIVVTVNPLPDTISGNMAVCYGAAGVLSNATPGGIWTSGNIGVAFIHPTSGTVLGMSVGTANITYTLSTGCIATKVISINAIPAAISGTAVLCKDATTMLYQSLPGGVWSSGNTAVATIDAAGLVTGVAAGTARMTYAFGSGCLTTTTVTVNPLPDTIAGNPALCYGFTSYFSNAIPGGSWQSSNTAVAPISVVGMVSALSYGTSIISYTLPTGCARGVVATVNPLPDFITGATNICVGIPTLLSTTTTGGTWSSGDTSIASIDTYSGVYTGISSGTVNITYTSAAGCFRTTTITVQALPPVIFGGPTVCAGFAVNLTNSMPGGTWSSDPAASMVGTINSITGVVTGITPGTVTVSYTVMTGCTRNLVVTVLVLPSVIGGSPNVCVGSTHFLTNTTPGGTWICSNPSRATIDPVTGAITGVSLGTAVVTYKVGTGCFNVLSISVHPLPAPITGLNKVCEGAIIGLSSTTPSGLWTVTHTDTATVGFISGIVTGVRAGNTVVSYTLPTGCGVAKSIRVDPTPPAITGNPHVCTGTSVILSNTMSGGLWVTSNASIATVGSLSGVVNSVTLGTAYISYVIPSTGCYAAKLVTVQPLPLVYSVTGGGNYCAGGSGVNVGLSGSQPGVSYLLYYGSLATGFVPGSGFPLDFGLLTPGGIYTVQATNVTSGCVRNMSGSATIHITPLVTPWVAVHASPDDTSCPGNTVTVTPDTLHSGTSPSFLWKVNGSFVSGAMSYSFIPADGDVVSVTMTSSANCLAAPTVTGSLEMTVLPSVIPGVGISADPGDTVCQFLPATYTAIPSFGGYSPVYRWMVNGLFAGSGAVYSYVPQHGDVIYCSMISNYLCRLADTVSSGDVRMVIDSLTPPRVSILANPGLTTTPGSPIALTAIAANAGAVPGYQWRVNGKPIIGATNNVYTAIFNDKDSIVCEVIGHGICDGIKSFEWVITSVIPLGVEQVADPVADIRLMPNPNKGNFRINGRLDVANNEDISVIVADMLGQTVYKGVVKVKGGMLDEEISLDGRLANGMYMLNLVWGTETKVFHFVIKQ